MAKKKTPAPRARPRGAPTSRKTPAAPSATAPAAVPPPAAPAPALRPHPVLSLAWLPDPGPVSVPGGPSTHPDRTPVPAAPSPVQRLLGGMVGRQVGLAILRDPPVSQGGAEIDMCAGCDVDCCTGHFIPINCHDAWRIRSTLNLPFRDFVGFVAWEKGLPVHAVRMEQGRFAMILKRRKDRGCGFLVRLGNERRCGIHGVRPDACRIFPYEPDLELQRGMEGDALAQIHPSHCPWRWPATPEHKARVLKDIEDNQQHRVFDRAVLTAWFWCVGVERTPETFFQFLEDEIPRRLFRPTEPSRYVLTDPGSVSA
jgi:Fe-S-cluster containining protein